MTLTMHGPPQLLFAGVDTLYLAVQGAATLEILERLQAARAAAQDRRDNDPELVELGPETTAFHIDRFGQPGGYHYRLSLPDPLSPVVAIRHNAKTDQWNGFVSIGSMSLLGLGYRAAFERAIAMLDIIGFGWLGYSINRVDYAMDFLAPDFAIDPECFVAPNRTTGRSRLSRMRDDSKEVAPIEGWAYEAVRKGRRYTSATLGKQPCLQVIVYDKRTEAIEQVKPHWFEVWGVDRNAADAKVWRVEVRAGGAHLKQRWNVRHIDDIDQQLPSIVARGLESFRCVVPSAQDSNVSRWPMSPLWAAAIAHARNVLLKGAPALDPDRLREIDRAQVKAMLEGQIIGCAGSLAHLEGVACSEDLDDEVSTIMAGLVGKALRHPKRPFQGAMKRAAKRYG